MRRLWLRADGGAGIGIGHVMRCIALAETAHPRRVAPVLVSDGGGVGLAIAKRVGLDTRDAAADPPWSSLVAPDDAVVFDGYHLVDEVRAVATGTPVGVRTAVVDDFGTGDFPVDVVVCPNPPGDDTYQVKRGGEILSGPRYAPVRPVFRGLRRRREPKTDRLLLSFGGADPSGLLERAVGVVGAAPSFTEVCAVVGPSAPSAPNGPVTLLRDPPDMARAMDAADAAVLAAGSTVWEACTMGLPIAAVPVADNQAGIIRALREGGAAILIESTARFEAQLAHAIGELAVPATQRRLAEAGMELVDGRGAERILDALLG